MEITCCVWEIGRALQQDSFATGTPQAGTAYLIDGRMRVEVTDGATSWVGMVDLPAGWNQ